MIVSVPHAIEKKKKDPPADFLTPPQRYNASQADVAVFKALSSAPDASKYPNAARWYKHIQSYESEFATLSGDASKPYTTYGPDESELTLNPAKAPAAAEDDDDVDLFGSDDEEEDAEAARVREERLAEYRKKKEGKVKPAAKSIVTLDVKPWGKLHATPFYQCLRTPTNFFFHFRRRDRPGSAQGGCCWHREGRSGLGSLQVGARRLRHQEAADQPGRRGREGVFGRAPGPDCRV